MKILFLDIDTLRPDHLGCYGYSRDTSPNIDGIAQDGVRFTGCHCSDAPCLPSRAGLVTGRFGIHNGVVGHGGTAAEQRYDGAQRCMRDSNAYHNLPAVMKRAGMYTVSFSSFADRHAAWWFQAGFLEAHSIGKRGFETADEVGAMACRWLRENRDRQDWFMHVHFWDPHTPFRTPEDVENPFEKKPLPEERWMTQEIIDEQRKHHVGPHTACEMNGFTNREDQAHPRQVSEIRNMEDYKKLIDGYDMGIWYCDRYIGALMEELKAQGIYEETAVIVTSDHGEQLGEKGGYQEHGEADEIVTHVPMIIKWPGAPRNAVSDGFHYNVDLLPTLIDLLGGVEPLQVNRVSGFAYPAEYDGVSYAEEVLGGKDGGREYLVLSQCAHVCQRSVRMGNWLYVRNYHDGYHLLEPEELFDLKNDPHERNNVAKQNPEVCWHAAWYLERWVSDNMLKMVKDYADDPLWRVIHEGGPYHCRGYLAEYCERLEQTGRGQAAAELKKRHPQEL